MNSVSSSNKRVAKNSIFLTFRMVIVLGISLYTTRALLGVLGVEDYGVYNVVCGFVSMFAFLNTALNNGIQRFYNFHIGNRIESDLSAVFSAAIIIQSILAIIILVLTESIGLWYINTKMVLPDDRLIAAFWMFQFSLISLLLVVLQIPYSAALVAYERMDYFAIVSIIDVLLKLIAVLLLPYFSGDKLVIYGFLLLLIAVLNFSLYCLYFKKNFKTIRFKRSLNREMIKNMLGFSGWNVFGSCAGMLKEQGLNIVLNLFFGPIVNAARGVAYQVSSGIKNMVSSINFASRPQIVQSYAAGNTGRMINIMQSLSKMSVGLLFIISLPVILEIPYILEIWLGKNIPNYTIPFVRIVLITALFDNLNPPISTMVHATGKMKKYQVICGCVNLLVLPVSYFSLKLGASPIFVFWVLCFFTVINQGVSLLIVRTLVSFSISNYLKAVIIPLGKLVVLCSLPPLLLHFLLQYGLIRFLITTIVSLIVSMVILYYYILNKKEKDIVLSLVSSVKNKIIK